MTTLQIALVCVTFLLTVGMIVGLIHARLPGETAAPEAHGSVLDALRPLDEVAVHVGDGQSFRGVVHTVAPGRLTLTGASVITGATTTPMQGLCHVPVGAIVLVQERNAAGEEPAAS